MNIEKEYIQKLLDSYLAAETTREEEDLLADYFCTHREVPAEWRSFSVLFRGLQQGKPKARALHKSYVLKWSAAAAMLVMAFLLLKPETKDSSISESTTTNVQQKPKMPTNGEPYPPKNGAIETSAPPSENPSQKTKRHNHEAVNPSTTAIDEKIVQDGLLAESAQNDHEKTTEMPDIDLIVENPQEITSEDESQMLAQLQEFEPEIYAYLYKVSLQAKEYQCEIYQRLSDANQQALELERQLYEELCEDPSHGF